MSKMKSWVNQISLNKKLIFYCYLILVPILLVINIFLFQQNYNKTVEEKSKAHLQGVQSLADSIDVVQTEMIDLCTYISINNDVQKILKSKEAISLNMDSQLWLHNAPMKIIQDMIAVKGYIKTIAIYPENGVIPYLSCVDASSYHTDRYRVRNSDMHKEACAKPGTILWQRQDKGYNEVYQANRTDKVVLYREIYDTAKQNALGYLVIGANADKFEELCSNGIQKKEGILLLSGTGNKLVKYGSVSGDIEKHLVKRKFEKTYYNRYVDSYKYNKSIIYICKNRNNGSIVCKIVPQISVKAILYDIAFTPLALLLGILIGLFPILLLVSKIVTDPLKKLCVAMEQFKLGDFEQRVDVKTGDELGEVADGFNKMAEDIKSLIENNYVMQIKEKESELNLLQAQINPHFLYNTLDSLYWQAENAGNEDIAEDVLALSQLFRMVLGQGKGMITVGDEKELISSYLKIQKIRFDKKMHYIIDIDEGLNDIEIPKLILQPFVENAVVHGLEKIDSNCCVKLKGERIENRMCFIISDTGIGMTKEQLDAIWNVEDSKRYSGQRVGGYAINNVKERLELKYHDMFSLNIESEPGSGTRVILEIPIEKKDGERNGN